MKLQIKKISIYCLAILGILLVSVIPVTAQDVNCRSNHRRCRHSRAAKRSRNNKKFPDYKRDRFRC